MTVSRRNFLGGAVAASVSAAAPGIVGVAGRPPRNLVQYVKISIGTGGLGFYPVDPVSGQYVVGTPLFERLDLSVGRGKTSPSRLDADLLERFTSNP